MITRVQVKNFRSLADVDVKLGTLTVLVGRNGAGKSAFLDAFRFVRDSLRHGLEDALITRHGIMSLRRWSPSKPFNIEISLTVERNGFWGEYSFTVVSGQRGTYHVGRELCSVGKSPQEIEDSYETKNGKWINPPKKRGVSRVPSNGTSSEPTTLVLPNVAIFSPLYSQMRRQMESSFYNIIPNMLREPQKPSTEKMLTDHGENFASVMRLLRRDSKLFQELLDSLARGVDGVSDLRIKEVGGYLVTELKHDDLRKNGNREGTPPWFELAQESDGTLRMLGMLVALYQRRRPMYGPTLLAIEEPENALHPGALAILSDVLREAARRHQLLITTQSPDLISRFNIDELRVVERINGITQIGLVDEMQREAVREQLFSAGDLLRIEGLRREPFEVMGDMRA